ncbi:hypothetical protein PG995_002825 [Apiospora arundinis]
MKCLAVVVLYGAGVWFANKGLGTRPEKITEGIKLAKLEFILEDVAEEDVVDNIPWFWRLWFRNAYEVANQERRKELLGIFFPCKGEKVADDDTFEEWCKAQ